MWLMLRELERLKVTPTECEGKIFGGANMFPGQTRADALHIGQKNGEAARGLLRVHRIRIVSESLFGVGHRQIIFNVRNGDVWARQNKLAQACMLEPQDRI